MQIDAEALRTLTAIIDQGSITKAASVLHVSRSAASWRIKRLEEHVGQELLVREGRSIRPSRAARTILDDARMLVETHDRIARSLGNVDLTGSVTVGGDTDADVAQLTRLLGSFRRVNPGVEVNLIVDRAQRIREGLAAGEISIGLVQGTDDHLEPTDRIRWTDDLVWVTSRTCGFTEGVVPLITFGDDCFYRELGEPTLDEAGIAYRIALSIPTTLGVVAAVEDGLGVALLPRHRLTDRLAIWERSAELPVPTRVHSIIRRAAHDESETVDLLADMLASELSDTERPATVAA